MPVRIARTPDSTIDRAVRQAQLIRQWRILFELTRYPEGRSVRDLVKALEVGPRTLYRDLATITRAGFRVSRARRGLTPVYRLDEKVILPITFNQEELASLALACHMVLSFPGSPFYNTMKQAIGKIQSMAKREDATTFAIASKRLYARIRRARPYTKKEIWFRMILEAIQKHRTVWIRYFTQERGQETDREVDPYGLMVHEGAFYMIGWCHLRKSRRTFLIDRIQQVRFTSRHFTVPDDFDLAGHFKNAWNMIRDRALVTVRARFDKSVARIIREGRWHESQKLSDGPDGTVILTVLVSGWEEIKRWLMGYGPLVEVLEPEDLRKSIVEDCKKITAAYKR